MMRDERWHYFPAAFLMTWPHLVDRLMEREFYGYPLPPSTLDLRPPLDTGIAKIKERQP